MCKNLFLVIFAHVVKGQLHMLEAIVGAGGLEVHFTLCTGLITGVCQNSGKGGAFLSAGTHKSLMGCIGNNTAFVALTSGHDGCTGRNADWAAGIAVFVADAHCRHIVQMRCKDTLIPPCVQSVETLLIRCDQQNIILCHNIR